MKNSLRSFFFVVPLFFCLSSFSQANSQSNSQANSSNWSLKTPALKGLIQTPLNDVTIQSFSYSIVYLHGSRLNALNPWGAGSTFQREILQSGELTVDDSGNFQVPKSSVLAPAKLVLFRASKGINFEFELVVRIDGETYKIRRSRGFADYVSYQDSLSYLKAEVEEMKILNLNGTLMLMGGGGGQSFTKVSKDGAPQCLVILKSPLKPRS